VGNPHVGEVCFRTIRRYTGGDVPIPYASWAILCEAAGLGRIWAVPGGSDETDADEASNDPTGGATGSDDTHGLRAYWQKEKPVFEGLVQTFESLFNGSREASLANIEECRNALVRMRQIAHVLTHFPDAGGSGQAVIEFVQHALSTAEEQMQVIALWGETS
jgi:hypothetical protein